jgi:lipopolysaccharide transport system permease protein
MREPNSQSDSGWTQIIQPRGRFFDLRLKELLNYTDLISLFVRRDFVAQYKQTILGPAWHIIQPLMTTIIFTIVFGKIAQIPTDGAPQFIFYLSGTVIWTYFANVLTDTSTTFTRNANIFGKVYFPRLVTPIATSISKLISFAIQFLMFIGFLIYYKLSGANITPNLWILATPILLLLMAALALGTGLLVTAMTTRYRDLAVLVTFGVQLWMYASPVIYPISSLPEKWQFWANLNPVAPIIESFRYAFLGAGDINLGLMLQSTLIICSLFCISLLVFNRVERTFADTI